MKANLQIDFDRKFTSQTCNDETYDTTDYVELWDKQLVQFSVGDTMSFTAFSHSIYEAQYLNQSIQPSFPILGSSIHFGCRCTDRCDRSAYLVDRENYVATTDSRQLL